MTLDLSNHHGKPPLANQHFFLSFQNNNNKWLTIPCLGETKYNQEQQHQQLWSINKKRPWNKDGYEYFFSDLHTHTHCFTHCSYTLTKQKAFQTWDHKALKHKKEDFSLLFQRCRTLYRNILSCYANTLQKLQTFLWIGIFLGEETLSRLHIKKKTVPINTENTDLSKK